MSASETVSVVQDDAASPAVDSTATKKEGIAGRVGGLLRSKSKKDTPRDPSVGENKIKSDAPEVPLYRRYATSAAKIIRSRSRSRDPASKKDKEQAAGADGEMPPPLPLTKDEEAKPTDADSTAIGPQTPPKESKDPAAKAADVSSNQSIGDEGRDSVLAEGSGVAPSKSENASVALSNEDKEASHDSPSSQAVRLVRRLSNAGQSLALKVTKSRTESVSASASSPAAVEETPPTVSEVTTAAAATEEIPAPVSPPPVSKASLLARQVSATAEELFPLPRRSKRGSSSKEKERATAHEEQTPVSEAPPATVHAEAPAPAPALETDPKGDAPEWILVQGKEDPDVDKPLPHPPTLTRRMSLKIEEILKAKDPGSETTVATSSQPTRPKLTTRISSKVGAFMKADLKSPISPSKETSDPVKADAPEATKSAQVQDAVPVDLSKAEALAAELSGETRAPEGKTEVETAPEVPPATSNDLSAPATEVDTAAVLTSTPSPIGDSAATLAPTSFPPPSTGTSKTQKLGRRLSSKVGDLFKTSVKGSSGLKDKRTKAAVQIPPKEVKEGDATKAEPAVQSGKVNEALVEVFVPVPNAKEANDAKEVDGTRDTQEYVVKGAEALIDDELNDVEPNKETLEPEVTQAKVEEGKVEEAKVEGAVLPAIPAPAEFAPAVLDPTAIENAVPVPIEKDSSVPVEPEASAPVDERVPAPEAKALATPLDALVNEVMPPDAALTDALKASGVTHERTPVPPAVDPLVESTPPATVASPASTAASNVPPSSFSKASPATRAKKIGRRLSAKVGDLFKRDREKATASVPAAAPTSQPEEVEAPVLHGEEIQPIKGTQPEEGEAMGEAKGEQKETWAEKVHDSHVEPEATKPVEKDDRLPPIPPSDTVETLALPEADTPPAAGPIYDALQDEVKDKDSVPAAAQKELPEKPLPTKPSRSSKALNVGRQMSTKAIELLKPKPRMDGVQPKRKSAGDGEEEAKEDEAKEETPIVHETEVTSPSPKPDVIPAAEALRALPLEATLKVEDEDSEKLASHPPVSTGNAPSRARKSSELSRRLSKTVEVFKFDALKARVGGTAKKGVAKPDSPALANIDVKAEPLAEASSTSDAPPSTPPKDNEEYPNPEEPKEKQHPTPKVGGDDLLEWVKVEESPRAVGSSKPDDNVPPSTDGQVADAGEKKRKARLSLKFKAPKLGLKKKEKKEASERIDSTDVDTATVVAPPVPAKEGPQVTPAEAKVPPVPSKEVAGSLEAAEEVKTLPASIDKVATILSNGVADKNTHEASPEAVPNPPPKDTTVGLVKDDATILHSAKVENESTIDQPSPGEEAVPTVTSNIVIDAAEQSKSP